MGRANIGGNLISILQRITNNPNEEDSMTTTTVYQSGNIGSRIANGLISGIADYYECSNERAQKAAEARFDVIVARDYPNLFLSWYPATSSVLGDYNADYSDVDFDKIFEEIGNCSESEYDELLNEGK